MTLSIHATTSWPVPPICGKMYDRFGSPGFLAAYNAGPARYQNHLDTGRALPLETRNYPRHPGTTHRRWNRRSAGSQPPAQDAGLARRPAVSRQTAEAGQTTGDDAQRITSGRVSERDLRASQPGASTMICGFAAWRGLDCPVAEMCRDGSTAPGLNRKGAR